MKIVVFDVIIVIDNSIPIELHHVHDTSTFITTEEALDLLTILRSETVAIVVFQDPTQEFDSSSEIVTPHIDFLYDHDPDPRLHLEDLSKIYNQVSLKIMTTTLNAFPSQKTNLKLTCIPLKWHVLQPSKPVSFCQFILKTKLIQFYLRSWNSVFH